MKNLQTVALAILLLGAVGAANAQFMTSTDTAGYLVFPKIIVHTAAGSPPAVVEQDTRIQITNTHQTLAAALHCFYVNANSYCSNNPNLICNTNNDCNGGICQPGWSATNFDLVLTPGQTLGWSANEGLTNLPCASPCGQDPEQTTNLGAVPPVPEDPFRGELKCIQLDDPNSTDPADDLARDIPSGRNDVKGEATIYRVSTNGIAVATYNAIGFQTMDETAPGTSGTNPLCLGTPLSGITCAQEYAGCPGVLILNHFFEAAASPFGDGSLISTELTLVPCSENLTSDDPQDQVTTTAQMLIYNEFEQRFSTSRRIQCYANFPLADIDTGPGQADDNFSIFSASVQGTLTGQTRIRGVVGTETTIGHGLIGVAEEFYRNQGEIRDTAAFNLHNNAGDRTQGDAVYR